MRHELNRDPLEYLPQLPRAEAKNPPQVVVQAGPHGKKRVQARISDNGSGVRYELRRKIFKRFFRGGSELERTTHGSGIGVFLVKLLIRRLKGRVYVHGRGRLNGATFELDLPGTRVPATPEGHT